MTRARSSSNRRARIRIAALGCGVGLALSPAANLNAAPEPVPSFEPVRTFLGKDFQAPHFYRPWGLASGDLNDDGWPDVVVVARGVEMNPIGSIFIFMNLGADANGWNGFAEPVAPILDLSLATKPYHVAIGDLDGDPLGMPDIAVAATGSDQVYIFLNEGDGTFEDPVPYNVPSNFGPRGIALGYFGNDTNHLDIAVASDVEDRVVVMQNDGSGQFTIPQDGDIILGTGVPSYTVVGGEFNATLVGEDDLVTPDWASGAQCSPPFVNDTISLMTNTGNYTYDVSQSYGNCSDVPRNFRGLAMGQFRGTDNDIAAIEECRPVVHAIFGNGFGGFSHNCATGRYQMHPTSGPSIHGIATGHINGGTKRLSQIGQTVQSSVPDECARELQHREVVG